MDQLRSTETYGIAPHVYVCGTGDGCVMLDLKRDKYLGLGRLETELVSAAIADWPKPTWACQTNSQSEDAGRLQAEELCRGLAAGGILVTDRQEGSGPRRKPLPDMRREWISVGDELDVRGRIALNDVRNFIAAFVWARCSLSLRPLYLAVRSVTERKARRSGEAGVPDILKLAAAVDVFRRLRPFLFAAEGRCLLHALALVRFLSRYDLYPDWIIGVATQPWAAHSWVQWGDFLLDSNPEKVCRYTPILSV
jgi:hypothetical protein